MQNFTDVKLEIFVPQEYALKIRDELAKIGVGTEYKIEVNCRRELVNEAIKVIKSVHPYEEPLINVIPLANHLFDNERS